MAEQLSCKQQVAGSTPAGSSERYHRADMRVWCKGSIRAFQALGAGSSPVARTIYNPGVAQLVARMLWEHDVAGSSPAARTIGQDMAHDRKAGRAPFFCERLVLLSKLALCKHCYNGYDVHGLIYTVRRTSENDERKDVWQNELQYGFLPPEGR